MKRALLALVFASATLGGCLEGDPSPLGVEGGTTSPSSDPDASAGAPAEVSPSNLCSKSSSQPATVTFKNRSSSVTVNVFWVDFACNESRYATLAPGAEHVQATFVSHPWRIRDAGTNVLYKEYLTVQGGGTVEFP